MSTDFKRLLGDATRLTRQGDLASATRAIRRALGADGAATGPGGTVDGAIDGTVGESAARRDRWAGFGRGFADRPVDGTDRVGGGAGGGAGPGSTHDGATGDGDAAGRATTGPTARADAAVIEGEWRRTDDGVDRAGGSAGRGEASNPDGTVVRARHAGDAGTLDYRLFVPPLAPDAPPPALVVMLHGCTQDAEDFATGTRMDALAREHGFLVLYPEQSGRANAQRCWNWFKHVHQRRGRGEPGTIEAMVRAVVAERGADPDRVFVAGLSAGGAMAAILGDVCPDLFAAVGVHSGLAAGSARDLPGALAAMRGGSGPMADIGLDVPVRRSAAGPAERQPPTIVFHGDADRTVHPDNGERVVAVCLDGLPTASEAALAPERREGRDGGRGWMREVHRDAGGRVVVERWCVRGAGHAWSGGDPRGSYAEAAGPDASAEMVRFFLATGSRT